MDNIYEFADRSQIEDEAWAWLIKLDGDEELNDEAREALAEWMQRSSVHSEELQRASGLWGDANVLTELAVPLSKKTEARVGSRFAGLGSIFPDFSGMRMGSAFSVLALSVVLGVWLVGIPMMSSDGLYTTQIGERELIRLDDGSVVELNTNSQVRVDYSDSYRRIRLLRGEAHFDVESNRERPFQVYAGAGMVEAVGTGFVVHLQERDIEVTVTEGRVDLVSVLGDVGNVLADVDTMLVEAGPELAEKNTAGGANKLGSLDAGQRATFSKVIDSLESIDKVELARQLAWRKGWLLFQGESLEEVVRDINRYSTISVEIADPAVRALEIGGQFQVGDTHEMLDSLEANFGLKVSWVGDDLVRLSAAGRSITP